MSPRKTLRKRYDMSVSLERTERKCRDDVPADDASSAPHEGDTGVVEVPLVLGGGLAHEHEALSVRDPVQSTEQSRVSTQNPRLPRSTSVVNAHLGSVKGLLEIIDELLLVTREGLNLRSSENLGSANTLLLDRRQAAREDGLADERDGHAEVERVHGGPLARSLLARTVKNLGHEGNTVVVVELENLGRDLDEVRVEHALVPGLEDCARGCRR
jgi:hypothetical protein